MRILFNFFKFIFLKIILLIQLIRYRVFRKPFSRNKIELIKHRLNFYSYSLSTRKPISCNSNYSFKKDISGDFFNIEISKLIGYNGAFVYDGQAPLLKTAIEIYKNPGIDLEESYLYKFYQNFQPKNFGELYKLKKKNSLHDLSSRLDFKPWINNFPNHNKKSKGIFGPIEKNEIEHRLLRLKNIFINIQKFGYIPNHFDMIEGYLILFENDYKFLITSGHHRVAALKTLNIFQSEKYKHILVKFDRKRSSKKIIDIKNINRWPAISSLYCSKEDALEFLKKFCLV